MRAGVLGLGEAGALYATGFLENGWSVTGYDPGDVPTRKAWSVRTVSKALCVTAIWCSV